MPAAITHYFHALRVLKESGLEEYDRDAFLWGAQGPDFFYCHRFMPWQKGPSLSEYGRLLHSGDPAPLLSAMRTCVRERRDLTTLSYLYGFLCHYSADRICHPYVCCQAERLLHQDTGQNPAICHAQMESMLDVVILRYEEGRLPVDFNLKKTVPENIIVRESMTGLYACVLDRLYARKVPGALLRQAVEDTRHIYGLMNDRTALKKRLVEKWERAHGGILKYSCYLRAMSEGDAFDYANVLLDSWNVPGDPPGQEHRESFFDMYERSVKDALHLLREFPEAADIASLTEGIPFVQDTVQK